MIIKGAGVIRVNEYKREYPLFSLCVLNCGLCPRYHTNGTSKCPGCGGEDFYLKHPSCAVINCSRKHGNSEYCYQCKLFPCEKYTRPNTSDSFISYINVNTDLEKAKFDIINYKSELNEKVEINQFLLDNFNDGKRKNFYCLAVNLLELEDLREIAAEIKDKISSMASSDKDKIQKIVLLFQNKAGEYGVDIKLRKQEAK